MCPAPSTAGRDPGPEHAGAGDKQSPPHTTSLGGPHWPVPRGGRTTDAGHPTTQVRRLRTGCRRGCTQHPNSLQTLCYALININLKSVCAPVQFCFLFLLRRKVSITPRLLCPCMYCFVSVHESGCKGHGLYVTVAVKEITCKRQRSLNSHNC